MVPAAPQGPAAAPADAGPAGAARPEGEPAEGGAAEAAPFDPGSSAFEVAASRPLKSDSFSSASAAVAPEPGSAQDQIVRLAKELATSRSGVRQCRLLFSGYSPSFGPHCSDSWREVDRSVYAESARVGLVELSADKREAVAPVELIGGPLDGVKGQWEFVLPAEREPQTVDYTDWRVWGWSEEFLRARMDATLGERYLPRNAADPLGDRDVRECAKEAFDAMSASAFTPVFLMSVSI